MHALHLVYIMYITILSVKDYPTALKFNQDTIRGFITASESRLAESQTESSPGFKLTGRGKTGVKTKMTSKSHNSIAGSH